MWIRNEKNKITNGINTAADTLLDNPCSKNAIRIPTNSSGRYGFSNNELIPAMPRGNPEIIIKAPLHINQPVDANNPAITENGTNRTKLARSNLATK